MQTFKKLHTAQYTSVQTQNVKMLWSCVPFNYSNGYSA